MYADQVTNSMQRAISETNRRRQMQMRYNEENGIDPKPFEGCNRHFVYRIRPANFKVSVPKSEQKITKPVKAYT